MEFEWDETKELINLKKHGISFQEATECFYDKFVIIFNDTMHSHTERRFWAIGKTTSGKILTVWYTPRGDKTRIIGAAEFRKHRRLYYEITKAEKI